MQAKGKRGNRTLKSITKIQWYPINDIAHMQHVHYDRTLTSFFCCTTKTWESSLRIFFGVYPDQAVYDAYNLRFAIPKSVEMAAGLVPDTIARYFSVIDYFKASAAAVITKVSSLLGVNGLSDATMLEITSCWLDTKHGNAREGYDGLLDLQRTLLTMRQGQPALRKKSDSPRIKLSKEATQLVVDGCANLDTNILALIPGEEFIDAYTYITGWTLQEVIYTIFTVGLYWIMVLRHRHGLNAAMVVTTHRVFEFCQRNTPAMCSAGSDSTWIARSWILTGLDAGVMCRERETAWTEIQTRFGSLKLRPFISMKLLDRIFYGMSNDMFAQLKPFLMLFASTDAPKALDYSSEQPLPAMITDHFPLLDGEKFAGYHPGDGIAHNPCQLGPFLLPKWLAFTLSFGRYPIEVQQELAVTSHRILASATARNAPWLLISCLDTKYQFLFWSNANSPHFLGLQIRGDVGVMETKWTRRCACLGCTGVSARSSINLSYAFSSDRKGFPIQIPVYQRNAKTGLLEEASLNQMRLLLGRIHAARCKAASGAPAPPAPPKYEEDGADPRRARSSSNANQITPKRIEGVQVYPTLAMPQLPHQFRKSEKNINVEKDGNV